MKHIDFCLKYPELVTTFYKLPYNEKTYLRQLIKNATNNLTTEDILKRYNNNFQPVISLYILGGIIEILNHEFDIENRYKNIINDFNSIDK